MANKRIYILGMISTMLFLLTSSGSSPLVSGIYSIFALFIIILIINFKLLSRNRNIQKSILVLIILMIVYFVGILAISDEPPTYSFFSRYIISFLLVSILVGIYKEGFFFFLEKSIFILVVVSLILFSLQILSFSNTYNFVNGIYENLPEKLTSYYYIDSRSNYASMIIYTINQSSSAIIEQRNSGFVYEPGYFSFFINLGLLFTLLMRGLKNKRKILIYLVALTTTASTTGIIGLMIVILIYFLNSNISVKLIFIPIILATIVLFFNISFGYEKVETLITERKGYEDYEKKASADKSYGVSMGRFTGFAYYATEVWQNSPVFGLSGLGWKQEQNISISNGIAHLIRNFGFLGLILMVWGVYLSSKVIFRQIFNAKYPLLFFMLIQSSLFAFPFSNFPIFWVFIVSAIVIPSRNKKPIISGNSFPLNQPSMPHNT